MSTCNHSPVPLEEVELIWIAPPIGASEDALSQADTLPVVLTTRYLSKLVSTLFVRTMDVEAHPACSRPSTIGRDLADCEWPLDGPGANGRLCQVA